MTCCFLLSPQKRGPDVPDGLEERSYFIDWIYQDLEPWKKHGIHEVGRGCR